MISPFYEFIRFPKRIPPKFGSYFPEHSGGPASYEVVTMKRQVWAIDGPVFGLRKLYDDTAEGFSVVEGFRCECCNRVFFAAELNDFMHECMESAN